MVYDAHNQADYKLIKYTNVKEAKISSELKVMFLGISSVTKNIVEIRADVEQYNKYFMF